MWCSFCSLHIQSIVLRTFLLSLLSISRFVCGLRLRLLGREEHQHRLLLQEEEEEDCWIQTKDSLSILCGSEVQSNSLSKEGMQTIEHENQQRNCQSGVVYSEPRERVPSGNAGHRPWPTLVNCNRFVSWELNFTAAHSRANSPTYRPWREGGHWGQIIFNLCSRQNSKLSFTMCLLHCKHLIGCIVSSFSFSSLIDHRLYKFSISQIEELRNARTQSQSTVLT